MIIIQQTIFLLCGLFVQNCAIQAQTKTSNKPVDSPHVSKLVAKDTTRNNKQIFHPGNQNGILNISSLLGRKSIRKSELDSLTFYSGAVFFAGPGFPAVQMASYTGRNCTHFLGNKVQSGTKVELLNTRFRNIDGSISKPISKLFIIQ